jgi:hypothetical protein
VAANDGLRDGRRFRIATRPIARKCANRDDPGADVRAVLRMRLDVADASCRAWTPECAGEKKPAEKAGFLLAAGRSATQWSSSSSSSA